MNYHKIMVTLSIYSEDEAYATHNAYEFIEGSNIVEDYEYFTMNPVYRETNEDGLNLYQVTVVLTTDREYVDIQEIRDRFDELERDFNRYLDSHTEMIFIDQLDVITNSPERFAVKLTVVDEKTPGGITLAQAISTAREFIEAAELSAVIRNTIAYPKNIPFNESVKNDADHPYDEVSVVLKVELPPSHRHNHVIYNHLVDRSNKINLDNREARMYIEFVDHEIEEE
jgi:hypothetical protein